MTYQEERQAEASKLQELCKQIAFYLNIWETPLESLDKGFSCPIWTYTKPSDEESAQYPTQHIQHTKIPEAQISISIETYGAQKGRIKVHGNYHMQLNGRLQFIDAREYGQGSERESFPEITCSATKGVDAVAKDIKRRFLPDYMRILKKAIERRNQYQASNDQTLATLRALAKDVLSPEHQGRLENRIKERPEETKSFYLEGSRGEVSVHGHDVTLKVDVSLEQARQILAWISQDNG